MAINFYREQTVARRKAQLMIVLFLVFSVLLSVIVAEAINMGYYLFLGYANDMPNRMPTPILLTISGILLSSIFIASFHKLKQLSNGNYSAIIAGGIPLKDVKNIRARTLRNTIEEMAISANIPVPHIHILEMEPSVNAFTAGLKHTDMSICITRGCLEKLNRDELQGLAAYQVAQIVNGYTQLNTLTYGVLYGLQFIHTFLSTSAKEMFSAAGREYDKEESLVAYSGSAIWLIVVLFPLWAVAYIGNFFAKIIKSIICRENVFQTDATAVRLNRNPNGLASVLQKSMQTRFSTILFADTFLLDLEHLLFTFGNNPIYEFKILHTHPDTRLRIKKIMPEWNGELPKTSDFDENPQPTLSKEETEKYHPESAAWALGIATMINPDQVLKDDDYWIDYARQPEKAPAVVAAMLAMHNKDSKEMCLDIAQMFDAKLNTYVKQLLKQNLAFNRRFEVLSIALPNLRLNIIGEEKINKYKHFLQSIIKSDNQITLFEHCVYAAVSGSLKVSLLSSFLPNLSKETLKQPIADLFMLTATYCNNSKNAEQNFQAACQEYGITDINYNNNIPIGRLSSLLLELDRLGENNKQQLIQTVQHIIAADGEIDDSEKDWIATMKIALEIVEKSKLSGGSGDNQQFS